MVERKSVFIYKMIKGRIERKKQEMQEKRRILLEDEDNKAERQKGKSK